MGWAEFCAENAIPVDEARSRGNNLYIRCPLCFDDPSAHLGLTKRGTAWGCLRDSEHRGRHPLRLIKVLLGCTTQEAILASDRFFQTGTESIATDAVRKHLVCPAPTEFRRFDDDSLTAPLQNQFRDYLRMRGLDPSYVASRFDLRWCVTGRYSNRLIVPFIFNKRWHGWTGRAITENAVRYKTADEKDKATKPDLLLFDYDNLTGGKRLLIGEGPFDAISVISAMVPFTSATALFGKNMSDYQLKLLLSVAQRYDDVYLSLDKAEIAATQQLLNRLRWYIPNIKTLASPAKDWGETDRRSIQRVFTQGVMCQ